MTRRFFFLLLVPLLVQNASAGPVEDAWDAYLSGNFSRVEQIAERALAGNSAEDTSKALIYMALGCSYAMRQMEFPAKEAFRNALNLNPDLEYTAADLPPPVWRIFKPVQDKFKNEKKPSLIGSPEETETKIPQDTVRISVPYSHSRKSVIKSILFPGWGQISEHDKNGYLFAGVEVLLIGGFTASVIMAGEKREEYMKAEEPAEISRKYDAYNDFYRLCWGLGIAAALNYMVAQYDFFANPPAIQTGFTYRERNPGFMISFGCEF